MDQVEPKVGDGVTYSIGSDRYPYTVVKILTPRRIEVRADDYRRTDTNGFSESQVYEYTSRTEGPTEVISKRKNGGWYKKGSSSSFGRFTIGTRQAYSDPSF